MTRELVMYNVASNASAAIGPVVTSSRRIQTRKSASCYSCTGGTVYVFALPTMGKVLETVVPLEQPIDIQRLSCIATMLTCACAVYATYKLVYSNRAF